MRRLEQRQRPVGPLNVQVADSQEQAAANHGWLKFETAPEGPDSLGILPLVVEDHPKVLIDPRNSRRIAV